jgi:beta propeller repeat protein
LERLTKINFRWLKRFLPPAIVALIIFGLLLISLPKTTEPSRSELDEYLSKNSLAIGMETVNGYQQIYYLYNDVKVYLTQGNVNHTSPRISKEYVTWQEIYDGNPQIVLYNLLDKTRLQLTNSGYNGDQSLESNRVVWERVQANTTQIYLYDGKSVRQLSKEASIRPSIKGDIVIYAQNVSGNTWQTIAQNISDNSTRIISKGDELSSGYPMFVGDQIKTRLGQ